MTEQSSPAARAADTNAHDPIADPTADPVVGPDVDVAGEAHGMRPIAMAFMAGNAAVLAVFALVVATGHLDLGAMNGISDVLLTPATAAPAN